MYVYKHNVAIFLYAGQSFIEDLGMTIFWFNHDLNSFLAEVATLLAIVETDERNVIATPATSF